MSKGTVLDLVDEKPKYRDAIESIVNYEEEQEEQGYLADKYEKQAVWEYGDVAVNPNRLQKLVEVGLIEKVLDTNSTTKYSLCKPEVAQSVLEELDQVESGEEALHEFPDTTESIDGLFDEVVGFEEAKWLIKRGMTTDDITNFLLVGPPGSAKTVFLLCIEELESSSYIFGPEASSSGFTEKMFEEKPKYLLIDEMDDMPKGAQQSMSSYMETGIVSQTKYGKDREMKTNAKTFAAANSTSPILDHIQNRFLTLEFDPYAQGEFIDVCVHILPDREGVSREEAETIANAVWEQEQEGNVRKAINVSRLSRGDPKKVIAALDDLTNQIS